jgi:HD-GYP domain-containing protein (c-di-GMP phosphodiesterase class II)
LAQNTEGQPLDRPFVRFSFDTAYFKLSHSVGELKQGTVLHIQSGFTPIKVLINGQELYNDGYNEKLFSKYDDHAISIAQDITNAKIDVYITAQNSLKFSAWTDTYAIKGITDDWSHLVVRLFGTTVALFGLVALVLAFIGKTAKIKTSTFILLGLQMCALGLLLFSNGIHPNDIMNVLNQFRVHAALAVTIIFLSPCILFCFTGKTTAWKCLIMVSSVGAIAGFCLLINESVLNIVLFALPFVAVALLLLGVILVGQKIIFRLSLPLSVIVATGMLSSAVFALNWSYGFYPLSYTLVLFIAAALLMYGKYLLHGKLVHDFMGRQLHEQLEKNAVWIEKIDEISAPIFSAANINEFCQLLADCSVEIVQEDLDENGSALARFSSKPVAVVAVKTDGVFEVNYTQDATIDVDFDALEVDFIKNRNRDVLFTDTHLDIGLRKNHELLVVCHVCGLSKGVSDVLKSVFKSVHTNMSNALENIVLKNEIYEMQYKVMLNLTNISDAISGETNLHNQRVSKYTREICLSYGMSEKESDLVSQAAAIHDLGKLAISEDIITKKEALTQQEFATMKNHVVFGYNMLSNSEGDFMKAAAIIAQQHHEQWNGGGYLGLKGEEINAYARIVSIADVFDALTSNRSYKETWTPQETKLYINKQAGLMFEQKAVQAFNACFPRLLQIHEQYRLKKEQNTHAPNAGAATITPKN